MFCVGAVGLGDAAVGLAGRGELDRGREVEGHFLVADGRGLAVVLDVQRVAGQQGVGGGVVVDRDAQGAAAVAHAEGQADDARRELRAEAQLAVHRPHSAEAADQRGPRAGEGGDVQAVLGVVLAVL